MSQGRCGIQMLHLETTGLLTGWLVTPTILGFMAVTSKILGSAFQFVMKCKSQPSNRLTHTIIALSKRRVTMTSCAPWVPSLIVLLIALSSPGSCMLVFANARSCSWLRNRNCSVGIGLVESMTSANDVPSLNRMEMRASWPNQKCCCFVWCQNHW